MVIRFSYTFFIIFSALVFSQKRLNDPSIVAQQKRQVFESWGDWRPYPKYTLGIQTNFAYSTVWGMLSPARNKRYKNGEDIRPLKAGGIENQRLAEVELQRKEVEKIKIEVDTLYKRNVQDFAHWTPEFVSADPLWLLYYKRMLRPLEEFPEKPKNYIEWRVKDESTFIWLQQTGRIASLQKRLDILKDKFQQSRKMAMPRGKRFLMYHECLLEWRDFLYSLQQHSEKTNSIIEWKKTIDKVKNVTKRTNRTDTEIVQEAINNYNYNQKKWLK